MTASAVICWTCVTVVSLASMVVFAIGVKFLHDSNLYTTANPDANNRDFSLLRILASVSILSQSLSLAFATLYIASIFVNDSNSNSSFADGRLIFGGIVITLGATKELLILVFQVSRLRVSFDGSAYALNNRTIMIFYGSIIFGMVGIVFAYFNVVFVMSDFFFYIALPSACLIYGIPIAVTVMFAKKLFQLILTTQVSARNVINVNRGTDASTDLTARQKKLLNTIVKQTILSIFNVGLDMVAFLTTLLNVITNFDNDWVNLSTRVILITGYLVSDAGRPLCLWFSFAFAETQYRKMCSNCHACLQRCLETRAIQTLEKNRRVPKHVSDNSANVESETE